MSNSFVPNPYGSVQHQLFNPWASAANGSQQRYPSAGAQQQQHPQHFGPTGPTPSSAPRYPSQQLPQTYQPRDPLSGAAFGSAQRAGGYTPQSAPPAASRSVVAPVAAPPAPSASRSLQGREPEYPEYDGYRYYPYYNVPTTNNGHQQQNDLTTAASRSGASRSKHSRSGGAGAAAASSAAAHYPQGSIIGPNDEGASRGRRAGGYSSGQQAGGRGGPRSATSASVTPRSQSRDPYASQSRTYPTNTTSRTYTTDYLSTTYSSGDSYDNDGTRTPVQRGRGKDGRSGKSPDTKKKGESKGKSKTKSSKKSKSKRIAGGEMVEVSARGRGGVGAMAAMGSSSIDSWDYQRRDLSDPYSTGRNDERYQNPAFGVTKTDDFMAFKPRRRGCCYGCNVMFCGACDQPGGCCSGMNVQGCCDQEFLPPTGCCSRMRTFDSEEYRQALTRRRAKCCCAVE